MKMINLQLWSGLVLVFIMGFLIAILTCKVSPMMHRGNFPVNGNSTKKSPKVGIV